MALAIALMAIVVIGALIGGTFIAGQFELGSGRSAVYAAQAQGEAETALTEAMVDWDTNWNTMPVDSTATTSTVTTGLSSRWYTVTRMRAGIFLIRGFGQQNSRGGTVLGARQLGRLARITYPTIDIQAAVTATGDVTVGGNAEITGNDENPSGWTSCTGTLDSLGGVRTTGTISVGGSADVSGDPAEIENDSTITNSLFLDPYNAFAQMVTFRWTGGTTTLNGQEPTVTGTPSVCDRNNDMNWGEPLRTAGHVAECIKFFPVIHATGNLRVQNGRGQGVILVGGDLEIRGNFIFDGIVIVLGEVRTTGTGNKVTGAILANNAQIGDLTSFAGDPDVIYSSCAVAQAMANSVRGSLLADRNWVQLY